MTDPQEEQQFQARPAPPLPWRIESDGVLARQPWGRRDWVMLGLLAGVAVFTSWPIVPLHRMASEMHAGDGTMFAHILSWGANTWWRNPLAYYNLPAFHPLTSAMTGTDGLVLPAICVTPAWLLTRNPILLYNLAIHLAAWFTLCSFYATLRAITPLPRTVIAAGAVLMTVNADRYWHSGGHANLIWTGAMALGFLAGWLVAVRPRVTSAVYAAFTALLALLCSWYFLVLSGFSALAGTGAGWITLKRRPSLPSLLCIVAALAGALLLTSPILLTYTHAQQRAGVTRGGIAESEHYSATLRGWLQPPDEAHRLATPMGRQMTRWFGKPPGGENTQFAGYLLLALLIAEAVRLPFRAWHRRFAPLDRLSAFSLAAALAAVLLSLGPYVGDAYHRGPYYLLHWLVLRFSGFFRCPARFAFLFQFFSAISIAVLLARVCGNRRGALRIVSMVAALLVCAENWPSLTASRSRAPDVEALSRMGVGAGHAHEPFVVLPDPGNCWPGLRATPFGRPMMNGWTAAPHVPAYDAEMTVLSTFPSLRSLAHIDRAGARWIVSLDATMAERAASDPLLDVCFQGTGGDLLRIRVPGRPLREWEEQRHALSEQLETRRRDENRIGRTVILADFVHDPKPWCWAYQADIQHRPGRGVVLVPHGTDASCLGLVPAVAVNTELVDLLELDFQASRDVSDSRLRLYWMSANGICQEGHSQTGPIERGARPGEYRASLVLHEHPNWFAFGKVSAFRFDFVQLLSLPGTELVITELRAVTLPGTPPFPF